MPAIVRTSRTSRTSASAAASQALKTGDAKLWVLLVGVNHYHDRRFPDLSYSALDCQGLAEAIAAATQSFPQRTLRIHHDLISPGYPAIPEVDDRPYPSLVETIAVTGRLPLDTVAKWRCLPARSPEYQEVHTSLEQIVVDAQPQDTVLFYFSGHGMLDPDEGQAILCLTDTNQDQLRHTGLRIHHLLETLSRCAAQQQIVWLDACHSGGMTFRGSPSSPLPNASPLPNPTPQLVDVLRQRAAQSRGFYALLSCDTNQQSWEFPELGHGVFTYFLMRGLLGEAADSQGWIEADALYKYVYYQTLRYIDKTNQQLRLVNQQRRSRGDDHLQPEYPLQTPKRIVEGFGELILGVRPDRSSADPSPRRAVVMDGLSNPAPTLALSRILQTEGQFELIYFPQSGHAWTEAEAVLQTSLQSGTISSSHDTDTDANRSSLIHDQTVLLYLRGRFIHDARGDAKLLFPDGTTISRSFLRQVLRRSSVARRIIILDCPQFSSDRQTLSSSQAELRDWIEDLQLDDGRGLCLMAASSPVAAPDAFATALLDALATADRTTGLSMAGWIAQCRPALAAAQITPLLWLSSTQGVMEVLPGQVSGSPVRRSVDLGVCPYRGLRAFGEADAPFFFGRDELIQQLVQAVHQRSVLVVVGASGSGKSSVVQAGLLAHLRQGKQLPGSDQWWMATLRPGARPLTALVQGLAQAASQSSSVSSSASEAPIAPLTLEGLLHLGTEGFVHWLRSRPEPRVVLVVDQFEELFTLATAEERQRFLEILIGGVEYASDRFTLILTLRSDFMTPCLAQPVLADWLQHASVLVPPSLTEAEYRQVIVQPAEKVGLAIEPELVTVLLQDLNHQSGELPLLEFVLEQLWEQRQPGTLTLQVYHQQIGGLKGALERRAQAVYEALDSEAKDCARWIFLSLTQLGDGTEDTRRRIRKSDLQVKKYPAALIERTLQVLATAKLIVMATDLESESDAESDAEIELQADTHSSILNTIHSSLSDTDLTNSRVSNARVSNARVLTSSGAIAAPDLVPAVTIEVAHEILIRHWSTLRWWLDENRTRLRTLRQIEQGARHWEQSGQQADFLLRGVRLDAAEELYVKYTDELSDPVQQFIEAGLAARTQEQQRAKRQLRRAQIGLILISGLGLFAAGLGGLAYLQRQRAVLNEITALNALSESQLRANQQLESLLTSLQAGHQLQQMQGWGIETATTAHLQTQTAATLQQAIAETQERNRLQGHQLQINHVEISPDGQRIASASDDGSVRIWALDGTELQVLPLADRPTDVRFSPDSQTIAVAVANGQVIQFEVATGQERSVWLVGDWVTSVAYSPDGQTLAVGSRDRTVTLWEVATGTREAVLSGHTGWVNQVAFSPDGTTLASASEDRTIRLWSLSGGQPLRDRPPQVLTGHGDRVTSLAFSPDGQVVISGSGDHTLRRWNRATGESQVFSLATEGDRSHGDRITQVAVGADNRIWSASADGTLRLWTAEGSVQLTIPVPATSVLSLSLSPDGQILASGGTDAQVRLWEVPPIAVPHAGASTDRVATSDRWIAAAGTDGQIRLWRSGRDVTQAPDRIIRAHEQPITTLQFSPDGRYLASGSDDAQLRLWEVNQGTLITHLSHGATVRSIAFSPDGQQILSGGDDRTVTLWNLATGQPIRSFAPAPAGALEHSAQARIATVSMSADGTLVAAGADDGSVTIWQADGSLEHRLQPSDTAIAAIAFSRDTTQLATASYDQTVQLWRLRDGQLLSTLTGHQDGVTSLAFRADGQVLATGSLDRTVRLWSVAEGDLIKQLVSDRFPILDLQFTPAGNLVSANEFGGVQEWTLQTDQLLEQGCDRVRQYLFPAAPHPASPPADRAVSSSVCLDEDDFTDSSAPSR